MHIVNQQMTDDFEIGKKIKINIGCGTTKFDGYYGIDLVEMENVDVVADLNEGFPLFPDNSVSEIITFHAFEHIVNFFR